MGNRPWNNWYHCTGNTYGTWIRGDERGWRARHHREHCEGDYKNPPPKAAHEKQRRTSKRLMKREPVALDWPRRVIVCNALAAKLIDIGAEVICAAVTAKHFHVLVRFTASRVSTEQLGQSPGMAIPGLCAGNALHDGRDPAPRWTLGMAKKHAAFSLRENGLGIDGGLWGTRDKCEPIHDRSHQIRTAWYILDQVREGAAVWARPELLVKVGERVRACA
jgi:hypothetical protein